eukprot:scaffold302_cov247-Pinguiococcus_pyrenoidosus.AAC.18
MSSLASSILPSLHLFIPLLLTITDPPGFPFSYAGYLKLQAFQMAPGLEAQFARLNCSPRASVSSELRCVCGVWRTPAHDAFCMAFDKKRAKIDAAFSAYAYCGASAYDKVKWEGDAKGFELVKVLLQPLHDVEGFVGHNAKTKDIMVVFRGSSSAPNWITNLDIRKMEYPHCEGCMVHEGAVFGSIAFLAVSLS